MSPALRPEVGRSPAEPWCCAGGPCVPHCSLQRAHCGARWEALPPRPAGAMEPELGSSQQGPDDLAALDPGAALLQMQASPQAGAGRLATHIGVQHGAAASVCLALQRSACTVAA